MPDKLIPDNYPDFNKHGTPPCAESYPDAFFAQEADDFWEDTVNKANRRKNSAQYRYEKEAKAICAACPYRIECAEYAINDYTLVGIWGGTTDRSRREIRRARKLLSVKIR